MPRLRPRWKRSSGPSSGNLQVETAAAKVLWENAVEESLDFGGAGASDCDHGRFLLYGTANGRSMLG